MAPLTEIDLETREAVAPSPSAAAEARDNARNVLALIDREWCSSRHAKLCSLLTTRCRRIPPSGRSG